ncbi:MAG TPA: hypothetical protein VFF73_33090 [Planctomycetota bacterium]|nr:hypothetical protein [Planctomycetota bacterium]
METPRDALPTEAAAPDDDAPISTDPVAEIRSLRAKNRILRAERTAIAGRKYVLETVVETLRQKLDELARAFATVQAGGDIAEAIKTVGSLVGDAVKIAEDREALEDKLDAERKERLTERRSKEHQLFELEERAAGLAAERGVLAERVQVLEAKIAEAKASQEGAEDLRRQLATATAELGTAAAELERAANDAEARARELSDVRAAHEQAVKERDAFARELSELHEAKTTLTAKLESGESEAMTRARDEHARNMEEERAKHARACEELQSQIDRARAEVAEERASREALNKSLLAAQAEHAHALETALEHGGKASDNERRLREEMAGTLEEERARMREALNTADAKRKALEAEKSTIEARLQARRTELESREKELTELRAKLTEQQPVLDALADRVDELEKEVTKLATRLGEARDRGKVDVKELLIRAALLKRREARAAEERAKAAAAPITRAPGPKTTGSVQKAPAARPRT